MNAVKASRGKLSLSIITFVVCALAFVAILYSESLSSVSSASLFQSKPCARKRAAAQETKANAGDKNASKKEDVKEEEEEYKLEFDEDICDITEGKWVYNRSSKPLYTDRSCPYVDRQFSCGKNGRPDSGYRYWQWQPDDCTLPRFNPHVVLRRLRGKRLMFVGDSLIRGQWQSFICMVESVIPEGEKSMKRGRMHSVFKAKGYDASIEFYWAPFLIESNSDEHIIGDPRKRILRVDSVEKHAKNWKEVDVLVFGTYVWWTSGWTLKTLWGSFANGDDGYVEIETPVAYKIGLKTWANWVDSTVDSNRTRVFYTTMSPTHARSEDWRKDGLKCFNETRPLSKKSYWGAGTDKRLFRAAADVIRRMKTPVTVVNITQISEYRVDGHASVYAEIGGKLLTEEERADPLRHADCIHWCLPGVPDTWNQILFALL